MFTFSSNKRDKHKVRAGDVFLIMEESRRGPEPHLFLVERANETIYDSSAHVGVGHEGEIVTRESWPSRDGSPEQFFCISLGYKTGRRYMNEQIDACEATRIAHFTDLDAARAAVRAWGEQKTDSLEVPLPAHHRDRKPRLVAVP